MYAKSLSPITFGLNIIGDAFYYITYFNISNDSLASKILAIIGLFYALSFYCYSWNLFIISLNAQSNKAKNVDSSFCNMRMKLITATPFVLSFVISLLF